MSNIPSKHDLLSDAFQLSPPCLVAQANTLGSNSLSNPYFSITLNGQQEELGWQDYDSGANLAQGCLAGAVVLPDSVTTPIAANAPEAYLLYRFGVLLTANSLAHRYWPNLPVANAYEQQIAQSIAQQNHLVIK